MTSQARSQNLLSEYRNIKVKVSKPTIVSDDILVDPIKMVSKMDLNDESSTHNHTYDESEIIKRRENFIKKFDFYLSETEEKIVGERLSSDSDALNDASQVVEEFTANNLKETNFWPALKALDETFTKPDRHTIKDHEDIIESLSEHFSYSPRRFTETLLTIIEGTLEESEAVTAEFRKYSNTSQQAEVLEEISSPNLAYSAQTTDVVTDIVKYSDSQQSRLDSTQYKRFIRKLPQIRVYPGTPQFQKENRRFSIEALEDEQYMTAESDCEESESIQSKGPVKIKCNKPATTKSEEPVASSSKKLDMSSIAYHHHEWMQAYEEVSKRKPVIAAMTQNEKSHTRKLKISGLIELQQKRQRCLGLIDELIQKQAEINASREAQIDSINNSRKPTTEFLNILRAFSEYLACTVNVKDAFKSTANNCQYFSNQSITMKMNKDLSPRLSVVHRRTKCSRKSLSKKIAIVKSPGAKFLSPYSKSSLKRGFSKRSKSPVVDTSSLRPVSQLRRVFSPGKRVAERSKFNLNLPDNIARPNAGFQLQPRSITQRKFKHVVSPVAQYIRGNKAT